MPETASEKEQLWQLGEARVFDQMTSDQASGSLKHEYYHLQDQHHDSFQMTRPTAPYSLILQPVIIDRQSFMMYDHNVQLKSVK